MFQMTLNKHEYFHGDRTIGGAIASEKRPQNTVFLSLNDPQSMQQYCSLDLSRSIIINKQFNGVCVCVFL